MAKKYITQYDRNGEIYYVHDIDASERLNTAENEISDIKNKLGEDGEVASKNLLNEKITETEGKINSAKSELNEKIDTNKTSVDGEISSINSSLENIYRKEESDSRYIEKTDASIVHKSDIDGFIKEDVIDSKISTAKSEIDTKLNDYILNTDETIARKEDLTDLVNNETLNQKVSGLATKTELQEYALKTEIPTDYLVQDDLANYITSEVLDSKLAEIKKCNCGYKVVLELPVVEEAEDNIIYLIKSATLLDKNKYDEYILVEEAGVKSFEKIGSASINLDEYYKKTEIDSKFFTKTGANEISNKVNSVEETANSALELAKKGMSDAELSEKTDLNDLSFLKAGKYHVNNATNIPVKSSNNGILETFASESSTYQRWISDNSAAHRVIDAKLSFIVNGKTFEPEGNLVSLEAEKDYVLSGTLTNAHIEIEPAKEIKYKEAGVITEFDPTEKYYTKTSDGNYQLETVFQEGTTYYIEDHKSTNIVFNNLYIESDQKVAIRYKPQYKSMKINLIGDNKIKGYTTESFTKQDGDEALIYSAHNIEFSGVGNLSIMNNYMNHAIKGSDITFKDRTHIYINNGSKTTAHDGIHATNNLLIENGIFTVKNCNDCFGADKSLIVLAGKFTVDTHNENVFDCKGSGKVYMTKWYSLTDLSSAESYNRITFVNESTAQAIYGEAKITPLNAAAAAVKTTGTSGETIYTLTADPLENGDKPEYELSGYFKDCQIVVPTGTNLILNNFYSISTLTDKNIIYTATSSRVKLKSQAESVNIIINNDMTEGVGTTVSSENSNLELSGSGTLFVISENKYAFNVDGSFAAYGDGLKFISGIDSADAKDGCIRAREVFLGNDKDGTEIEPSLQNIFANSIYARQNKKNTKGKLQVHTLQTGYIFTESIMGVASTDIASNVKIIKLSEDTTELADFEGLSITFPEWIEYLNSKESYYNQSQVDEKLNKKLDIVEKTSKWQIYGIGSITQDLPGGKNTIGLTEAPESYTIMNRGAYGNCQVGDPVLEKDIVNKQYADTNYETIGLNTKSIPADLTDLNNLETAGVYDVMGKTFTNIPSAIGTEWFRLEVKSVFKSDTSIPNIIQTIYCPKYNYTATRMRSTQGKEWSAWSTASSKVEKVTALPWEENTWGVYGIKKDEVSGLLYEMMFPTQSSKREDLGYDYWIENAIATRTPRGTLKAAKATKEDDLIPLIQYQTELLPDIESKISENIKANQEAAATTNLEKLTIGATTYKLQKISYTINEEANTIDITIE